MTYQSIYDRLAAVKTVSELIKLFDITDIYKENFVSIELPVSIEETPISREDAAMWILNLHNATKNTDYFDYAERIEDKIESFENRQSMMGMMWDNWSEKVKTGVCPCCQSQIVLADFKDQISYNEYMISGMCNKCQEGQEIKLW
jgi:hypothetical protein